MREINFKTSILGKGSSNFLASVFGELLKDRVGFGKNESGKPSGVLFLDSLKEFSEGMCSQAFGCPVSIGIFKDLCVKAVVPITKNLSIDAGQSLGLVGFPQSPDFEIT